MINKDLRRQPIQYIAPEDLDPDNFIACNTHELFLISTHFTRIPKESDPEWDEVYYFIQRDALYTRLEGGEGYVYILQCDNQPGLVKIGMTERTPQERLKEINRATGVLFPFYIVKAYPCKSPRAVEQLVHLELDKFRVNTQKEGFAVFPEQAMETIDRVIEKYGARLDHKPRDLRQDKKYWFTT